MTWSRRCRGRRLSRWAPGRELLRSGARLAVELLKGVGWGKGANYPGLAVSYLSWKPSCSLGYVVERWRGVNGQVACVEVGRELAMLSMDVGGKGT